MSLTEARLTEIKQNLLMIRNRQAIIHIGTEKTGTTTLQHTLLSADKKLRTHGIAYLSTPGRADSRALAAACQGIPDQDEYLREHGIDTNDKLASFREQVFTDIRAKITQLPDSCHTVVISSEHFHSRLRDRQALQQLRTCLDPLVDRIQIICYIRRQVDVATSLYSTMLKSGRTDTLESAVRCICHPHNHYFNYETLLDLWIDVFNSNMITVRQFAPSYLINGNIVSDFLAQLDIPTGVIQGPKSSQNKSIKPLGQALIRFLNKQRNSTNSTTVRTVLDGTRKAIARIFAGQGEQLPTDVEAEIQGRFEEINEVVRQRWFPGETELFTTPDSQSRTNIRKHWPV